MIPHFDLGGGGSPLHFIHANGYPPDCYGPLLELLKTEYHVFGMHLRPLWSDAKPEEFDSWNPLTEDLLRFLSDCEVGPVVGVGHSIGGIVTLRAALRDPEKFRALVLFDPVLFPPYFIKMWNIVRALGIGHSIHPLIPGAMKRRREFDSLELVFRGYRTRKIFRYLSDEYLWAYIRGITRQRPNGRYELVYTPEWEAHIYYTGIWRDMEIWRALNHLEVPTLIIRGAETDTFWASTARLVKREQPRIQIEAVRQSTHLVPLERPKKVFEIVKAFLADHTPEKQWRISGPGKFQLPN
ncbi:MAG: alpha/beta hydrolase [Chloroflexota bacterium]